MVAARRGESAHFRRIRYPRRIPSLVSALPTRSFENYSTASDHRECRAAGRVLQCRVAGATSAGNRVLARDGRAGGFKRLLARVGKLQNALLLARRRDRRSDLRSARGLRIHLLLAFRRSVDLDSHYRMPDRQLVSSVVGCVSWTGDANIEGGHASGWSE